MTSNDIQTVHVIDDRLKAYDKINFAVRTGGQQVTSNVYNAQSQSTNAMSYSIQVPDKNTCVDRRILLSSTVVLQVTGIPKEGRYLIEYGYSSSLSPFPLHALCVTQQCQINSNTISTNTRDVLYPLLVMHDRRSLVAYNSQCPTLPDGPYQTYADGYLLENDWAINRDMPAVNNTLADHQFSSDSQQPNRGAFNIDKIGGGYLNGAITNTPQVIGNGIDSRTSFIQFTTSEPLIALSPWTYNEVEQGALFGITNLNFTFNLDASDSCRAFRASGINTTDGVVNCQALGYKDSTLTINYLTPQQTSQRPPKCLLPYYEVPRYIFADTLEILSGETGEVTMSSIALNNIPDMLIIYARKPLSTQKCTDSDFFLSPQTININFNNNSGIMSGTPQRTLYNISRKNGLNCSWAQFSGYQSAYKPVSGDAANIERIPTCGAPLVLAMGQDIELPSYLSASSIGNFTLNFTMRLLNQSKETIKPELVVITVNSGIFTTYNGSSSIFTAILNRSDVLDASQQRPIGSQDVRRLVGSGFMDNLKALGSDVWSGVKAVAPFLAPVAKQLLNQSNNKYGKTAGQVIGALGYGDSGGRKGALHRRIKSHK